MSREKGRELPPSRGWRQFSALSSRGPAVETIVHINDNIQIFHLENYGSLMEIINPCSQFGLRVNEIPNKTFIMNSHQPLIGNEHIFRAQKML
jgi:hypothetical protein